MGKTPYCGFSRKKQGSRELRCRLDLSELISAGSRHRSCLVLVLGRLGQGSSDFKSPVRGGRWALEGGFASDDVLTGVIFSLQELAISGKGSSSRVIKAPRYQNTENKRAQLIPPTG